MARTNRSPIFWCLAALLLLGFAPLAGAEPVRIPIPASAMVAVFEGFAFPKEFAGLARTSKVEYGEPRVGFSVSYGNPGESRADVYIYDRGLDLSSDPRWAIARRELETVIDDVHTAMKAGHYQSVVLNQQGATGPFVKAHLSITKAGTERDSFAFVTVHKSKFVKIRFTTSAGPQSDRLADAFASTCCRTLRGLEMKRAP